MSVEGMMTGFMSVMNFLTAYGPQIAQATSMLVGAASLVNTMIPAGKPGSTSATVKQVINGLSLGIGHATPTAMATTSETLVSSVLPTAVPK